MSASNQVRDIADEVYFYLYSSFLIDGDNLADIQEKIRRLISKSDESVNTIDAGVREGVQRYLEIENGVVDEDLANAVLAWWDESNIRTKSVRKTSDAQYSRSQITDALRKTGGNARAAAQMILNGS